MALTNETRYITSKKAMEKLGVSIVTLRNWEKQGVIEAIRTNGNHRLYNIDKYLQECETKRKNIPDVPNIPNIPNINNLNINPQENKEDKNYTEHPNVKIKKKNIRKSFDDTVDKLNILDKDINKDKVGEETNNEKVNICYIRVTYDTQIENLEKQRAYFSKKYPSYQIIEDIGSGIDFNRRGFKQIQNLAMSKHLDKLVIANKQILLRTGFDFFENIVKNYSNGTIIIDNNIKNLIFNQKEEMSSDINKIIDIYNII